MTIDTLHRFSIPVGFTDSATFAELADGGLDRVPRGPGVYLVLAPKVTPSFSEVSCGGHFKGRNPTVPVPILEAKWVGGAPVLYVGKANELRRRIREFVVFGSGKAIGHWGGRYIWQLAGCQDLGVIRDRS